MKPITITTLLTLMMTANSIFSKAESLAKDGALSPKEQQIVAIAAFTANGDLVSLTKSLHEGLDAGLTISEVKEVIVQLYAYAGFPRSLNALQTFMNVLRDRKQKGIADQAGKPASPLPAHTSKLEFGTAMQTRLVGSPVKGPLYEFAPVIDQFLKEHLFGDIFGRDVLDFRTREIATISALACLGGTENQLRSHFNVGMHNGLTKEELDNLVTIIQTKVGPKEGNTAALVLQAVLKIEKAANHTNDVSTQNFVGAVRVSMIVPTDSIFNTQMASVTFEPGARTNWHYHPSGQILVITEGSAYYQEKGKAKQILSKGQVVKCPPGVPHWHGATRDGSMTHLAVSPNLQMGSVVWLEKVTNEEYENSK